MLSKLDHALQSKPNFKAECMGFRDGAAVKGGFFSSRGSKLNFPYPHYSRLPSTPVPAAPGPFSGDSVGTRHTNGPHNIYSGKCSYK